MSKPQWDGAEEPTINNFLRLVAEKFKYALLSANRPKPTAVFHMIFFTNFHQCNMKRKRPVTNKTYGILDNGEKEECCLTTCILKSQGVDTT